jgi:hypothetical protein
MKQFKFIVTYEQFEEIAALSSRNHHHIMTMCTQMLQDNTANAPVHLIRETLEHIRMNDLETARRIHQILTQIQEQEYVEPEPAPCVNTSAEPFNRFRDIDLVE